MGRGTVVDINGEQTEEYRQADNDDFDGPGGGVETYSKRREPYHRDSNFAKPIQRQRSPYDYRDPVSEEEHSEAEEEEEGEGEARYSKHYQFTIASPDEEMHGKAVALFDFVPEHENELPLQEGQIILVSYRHGQGWLVAEDKEGESGLVPEEFVRLLRHIEGGLNGLQAVDLEEGGMTPYDLMSPVSVEPTSAVSLHQDEAGLGGHTPTPSNGGTWGEKHPAVQSNFSTSSKDFSSSPLKKEAGAFSPEKEQ